jgi:hypothetical protein
MKNRALLQLLTEYQAETGDSLPLLSRSLLSNTERAAAERERYDNDPEYRESKKTYALKWNKSNPDRKRKNDKKWAKKHGAEAARRYRARKKESK